MATTSIRLHETPLVRHLLRRADDALILGHRLSEWIGHAPMLEEELALANIALDLIGQARVLYTYAGCHTGHDEDQLAYLRDARDWRNCLLVELPNGDFAFTIARVALFAGFMELYWRAGASSADATLAGLAAKAEKESAYHFRHAAEWLIRLGGGTGESHRRAAEAIQTIWPYTGELFETDAAEQALIAQGLAPDPAALRAAWDSRVCEVLARAELDCPAAPWMQTGGRCGLHTEHLGYILTELQYMQRTYPGARW